MTEQVSAYLAIFMIAAIVFASRLAGYMLGSRVPEDGALRRLFDVLPGCAIAAVVAPVIFQANLAEIAALLAASAVLWFTGSMGAALALGLGLLIAGAHLVG